MILGAVTDVTLIDHITSSSSTTKSLAVVIIGLAAATLVLLLTLMILPTGINPIREAVSDHGVGEYRNFYRLAAFWLGLAGLLMAVMLGNAIFPKPSIAIILMLLFAGTRWAITIFPTDLPGEEETSVGRSHTILAVLAFASFAVAAGTFYFSVHEDPFWHSHHALVAILGWAVVVTAIATGLTRRLVLTNIFGLIERLLYVAMCAWLIGISALLLNA